MNVSSADGSPGDKLPAGVMLHMFTRVDAWSPECQLSGSRKGLSQLFFLKDIYFNKICKLG